MTRLLLAVIPVSIGDPWFACCRRPHVRHIVDYAGCDCLRTELPIEAQAKSSGRLATPERNHTCPACRGDGWMRVGHYLACCPRCAGAGEVRADRSPAGVPTDAELRGMVSAARAAGKLGLR